MKKIFFITKLQMKIGFTTFSIGHSKNAYYQIQRNCHNYQFFKDIYKIKN